MFLQVNYYHYFNRLDLTKQRYLFIIFYLILNINIEIVKTIFIFIFFTIS